MLLPAPNTRLSPAPSVQTKVAGRSGQLFVNHNTTPVASSAAAASPHTAASLTSSTAVLPPSGPLPPPIHGFHHGGCAGGLTSHNERPAYATKRRGLARGTTVANIEARRCSDTPLVLGVEGVQTGEEVPVDGSSSSSSGADARRRSVTRSSGTVCQNPQDHAQVPQLKRQLEKANASVKALTAGSRRQKQEHDAQRAMWEVQLTECEIRVRAVLAHNREREELLCQHVSEAVRRSTGETQLERNAQQSAAEAHHAEKVKWEAELAALRQELEVAKASAAAQAANDSAAAAAARKDEVERLRAELEVLRSSTAEKQLELETSLADAQSTLNRTAEELRECRQVQKQCNYLVQQCRLFIRQVCQPGFSVVKGPSLEPVEKNRPEPTGFVLVPLTVLLHGYTLLPECDRQEVIDHYDKEAKALQ